MPTAEWWQDLDGLRRMLESIGVVLAAWWAYRAKKTSEGHGADMKTVREQVKNSHSTNLRDDMDTIRDDVKTLVVRLNTLSEFIHDDLRRRRTRKLPWD